MRIVKQVRATFGDALWADFVTHANARYTSTPSYVPSVALLSVALIGLNVNRLRYPIRSDELSFCTSLSTSLICSAPCGHGHLDLRVVHGEHLRISPFLPDAVKVHRPERVGVPMAG